MGKTSGGVRMRRRLAIQATSIFVFTAAVAIAVVVVAYRAADRGRELDPSFQARGSFYGPTSGGGTSASVDVPLALLSDYFEHFREHAPPRDPRGVMQKREAFYQPPRDPVALLDEGLTDTTEDRRLRQLLGSWKSQWAQGGSQTARDLAEFQASAERTSLDPIRLFQAAHAMQFMDGNESAAALIRAGLAKAARLYSDTRPGDPKALSLLHQLDQTSALWNVKDFVALEARFRLARKLYAPLSIDARRAGYLLSDALFEQKRFKEAEAVVMAVMEEHRQVGDLGMLEGGDVYEMTYQVGYIQFSAGDFEPAVQNLRLIRGGEHDQVAAQALFCALLKLGRLREAESVRKQLEEQFHVSRSSVASLAVEQEQAAQLEEWRNQMRSSASFPNQAKVKLP